MARNNNQNRSTKQKKTVHVKSWTGPKPPAKVRPIVSTEPTTNQSEKKPDNSPEDKRESSKTEK